MSSLPSTNGLNTSTSSTRRQAYHLPSRVISPPPPITSFSDTAVASPHTPPQQEWVQPPAVILTPPPHHIPLPRSTPRNHVNQSHCTPTSSDFQRRYNANTNITPAMYEMSELTIANEFPLPPSSAGSRSPRSPQTGFQNSPQPDSTPLSFQSPYTQNHHSPTQDIRVNSPSYQQQPPAASLSRSAFPKPLYLSSSNYNAHDAVHGQISQSPQVAIPMPSYSPATANQYRGDRLLPSPMAHPNPTNNHDPFQEVTVTDRAEYPSIFSPPDTAATDDTFPPNSPTDSLDDNEKSNKQKKNKNKKNAKKPAGPPPLYKPTIKLLFSYSTRKEKLTLLLPACILSIGAGIMPPIMTFVLGDAFALFADYQTALSYQSTLPESLREMISKANADLKSGMITVAIKFIMLGVFIVILTTAGMALWIVHGERVARRLRMAVYLGVSRKPMAWFDLGMGKRPGQADSAGDETAENESSGGLMGRFSTETDHVRMAVAAAAGRLVSSITTALAGIIVSFWHSWSLTLVILAVAPILAAIQIGVEMVATPLLNASRHADAAIAAKVERATGAISTVKAFNAEEHEIQELKPLLGHSRKINNKTTMLWGFRLGTTYTILFSTFVAGFWFGNFLVTSGQKTSSQVTIAFWAVFLASNSIQGILPALNNLDKAKIAMAALLETAADVPDETASRPTSNADSMKTAVDKLQITHIIGSASPPQSPTATSFIPIQPDTRRGRHRRVNSKKSKAPRDIKKIHPSRFTGELALHNVTFHYPSRPAPAPPALNKVTMFLPARDTTYIVGGSGSGKSTVGALLLGLYKPENGRVEADEQGIEWLDEKWLRGHIGMVSQGASVIFDGTVHENVALGVVGQVGNRKRKPEDVSRQEVIQACKIALFHDFVKDLPDGYDTILSGEKGASLSGGQRQRLALARAYLKDPTVLILDEATSALDTVSRSLVYETVKQWRRNKTTIIITHDLSPITNDDFVYVMRDGEVVEEGYRRDLESNASGWFRQLAHNQASEPEKSYTEVFEDEPEEVLGMPDIMLTPSRENRLSSIRRLSFSPGGALPIPGAGEGLGEAYREFQENKRLSRAFVEEQQQRRLSVSPNASPRPALTPPLHASPSMQMTRSHSSQRMNASPYLGHQTGSIYGAPSRTSMYRNSQYGSSTPQRPSTPSARVRPLPSSTRSQGPRDSWYQLKQVTTGEQVEVKHTENKQALTENTTEQMPTLAKVIWTLLKLVPSKFGMTCGFLAALASGAATPIFSSQFSQLIAALASPGSINLLQVGLTALGVTCADGALQWARYTVLSQVVEHWIVKTQEAGFRNALMQDKAWYDDPVNTSTRLMTTLVKDADDARDILSLVAGSVLTVAAMLLLGIIWAFVSGWQLTLVGLATGPLFLIAGLVGSRILSKYERTNRIKREECARQFFTCVSNVKAIRSMSLEPVLLDRYEAAIEKAYQGGIRCGPIAGFEHGLNYLVTYCAQAIMLLVGALFMIGGSYTFTQVMQVFTLLILSITSAAGILGTIPHLTKVKHAVVQLLHMYYLSTDTAESQGRMTFPVSGRIVFDKVCFTYPSRPDAQVLHEVSFEIQPGECVAIVGPSGSGKSTIAALLQRLYDPADGMVRIDGRPTTRIDVKYLRDHVAVVSQIPALFDMSVADNISYGSSNVSREDIVRAAKAAHLHDFILTLPNDYDTSLGENASLISGGQAQRLQIARALLKPREILLGDEITSALDVENQEAVMNTIMDVKKGRTTVLITHTLATMQMCDRLIVMEKGRVVQQGSFQELQADTRGLFASLARAGEWNL